MGDPVQPLTKTKSMLNVSAELTAAQVGEIKGLIASLHTKLPFLVNLTADERRALFKKGHRSQAFVENSLLAAQNNPNILPPSFDVNQFARGVALANQLGDIKTCLEQLVSQLDDTSIAVGSDALRQASQVYEYVKAAAKVTPGLKPVAEQLSERFQKSRNGNGAATVTRVEPALAA